MSSRSLKEGGGPLSGSIQEEQEADVGTDLASPTTAAEPETTATSSSASPGHTPFPSRRGPKQESTDDAVEMQMEDEEDEDGARRVEPSPAPVHPTTTEEGGASSPQPPRPAPGAKRPSMATVRRSAYYGSPAAAAAAAASPSGSSSSVSGVSGATNSGLPVPVLKVVVIGPQNVGKTSLIGQLTKREFHTASKATVGVECKEHVFDGIATLQLWDVAGQQRYGTLTKQYYRWSAAVVVVAAVNDADSLALALEWKRDVMEKIGCVAAKNTSAIVPDEVVVRSGGAHSNSSRSASVARGPTANLHQSSPQAKQPTSPAGSPRLASSASPAAGSSPAAGNNNNNSNALVCPIFLFMNKTDLMKDATMTAAEYEAFSVEHGFTELVFVSAKDHGKVSQAFQRVAQYVTDMQEANGGGIAGSGGPGGSSVNLNALRRSVRVQDPKGKEKKCCK